MKKRGSRNQRVEFFAETLKALGSGARLRIVRLLIQAGPPGMCVTDIQKQIGGANSTLSHHLDTLAGVGLVTARREAQWIYYSVNYPAIRELLDFLYEDCCSRVQPLIALQREKPSGR
jgi:ArsR family transcriptional regulator